MENNKFDKTLKDKLESLDPQYEATSWDALADRLDAVEDVTMDETVREKLESVDVPYEATSWTVLQDKMQSLEDAELDDLVREKVEVEADDYSARSWMDLLRRLESWERVRREFWTLRSAEALMIILLLLAVYQYGPVMPGQSLADGKENSTESSVGSDRTEFKIGPSLTDDIGLTSRADISQGMLERTREVESTGLTATMPASDVREMSSHNGVVPSKEDLTINPMRGSDGQVPPVADGEEVRSSDIANSTISLGDGSSVDNAGSDALPVAFLDGATSELQLNAENEFGQPDLQIPEINTERRQVWLTLQSHSALNRVYTPKNEEFDARNVYTLGYGMGMLIGFAHGKFMWETGVEYQLSLFRPKRTKLTGNISDGYRKVTLSEVNLDYVNIPLQARYLVHATGRHEFYAMGGVKLHISSKVDFDFVEERDVNNQFPVDFSEPPEEVIGVNKGRFTYFSFNAGLGYQFMLNTRTKLFAQPSYEHFAEKNGIMNLNGEKVNTYRLDFGVRVRL